MGKITERLKKNILRSLVRKQRKMKKKKEKEEVVSNKVRLKAREMAQAMLSRRRIRFKKLTKENSEARGFF